MIQICRIRVRFSVVSGLGRLHGEWKTGTGDGENNVESTSAFELQRTKVGNMISPFVATL